MVLSTVQPNTKSIQEPRSRALGYDFALLGLTAAEARVEVIRQAATETASRIQTAFPDASEQDGLLSDLATSTYRLLDPRKRRKRLERIQLSVFSEADLELQKDANDPLLPQREKIASRALTNQSLVIAELAQIPAAPTESSRRRPSSVQFKRKRRVGTIEASFIASLATAVIISSLLWFAH